MKMIMGNEVIRLNIHRCGMCDSCGSRGRGVGGIWLSGIKGVMNDGCG